MHTFTTCRPFAVLPEPTIGIADLDLYDDTIAALDLALRDADLARRTLDAARRTMDTIEARHTVAGLPGKNEAERKAYLLLALLDDIAYRDADGLARDAADQQRASERQVRVLTERCRLLRASLGLRASA